MAISVQQEPHVIQRSEQKCHNLIAWETLIVDLSIVYLWVNVTAFSLPFNYVIIIALILMKVKFCWSSLPGSVNVSLLICFMLVNEFKSKGRPRPIKEMCRYEYITY